jgi:hypothetical protein
VKQQNAKIARHGLYATACLQPFGKAKMTDHPDMSDQKRLIDLLTPSHDS